MLHAVIYIFSGIRLRGQLAYLPRVVSCPKDLNLYLVYSTPAQF